jgi:hypothetical protein
VSTNFSSTSTSRASDSRLTSVLRQYQPDDLLVEELVEVLHKLLLEVPGDDRESNLEPSKFACILPLVK